MMIAAVREKIITTSLHPSVSSSMGDGTRGRLSGGVAQGQRRAKFHVRSHFGLGGCFSFRSLLHPFVVPRVPQPLLMLKCATRKAVMREDGAQRRRRVHGQVSLNAETREVLARERVWN